MEPEGNQEPNSIGMETMNLPPVEVVKEGAVEEAPPAEPILAEYQQAPFVVEEVAPIQPVVPEVVLPPAEPTGPVEVAALDHFDQPLDGTQARSLAAHLIHTYFTSQLTPLTQHHIESYDQFLQRDLRAIIASHNPILIYKNPKSRSEEKTFKYKVEIYIGGEQGNEISVCTPTVMLQEGNDVRLLYPNEARLRNLTYAVQVEAKVLIRTHITLDQPPTPEATSNTVTTEIVVDKIPLCNIPLMLHSRYCMLHGKSKAMLTQMGECPQDQGGYFIIDGSEKVLVTRQEAAFNTLWISEKLNDPKNPQVHFQGAIASINPKTRQVSPVMMYYTRDITRTHPFTGEVIQKAPVLEVSIPQVLKPIPVFVLFRALGIQSDKDILQMIFPDLDSPETKFLVDLLHASILAAQPFPDTYSAVQYIKSLTKGFSEFHVLDILHTQLFPHVEDLPGAKISFLADCVRKMLRVVKKIELPASRDDTRYQRLQTSGFLCQKMFLNLYKAYVKSLKLTIDNRYAYNESMYSNMDFLKIFNESNRREIFQYGFLTQGILRAFKGKWMTGPNKEESGVIQEMSRLSYLDFMSHTRRAVLEFDESIKLPGPRRLHPSQYGYFCTSETPSGAHIGITKNLSIMTAISTGVYPDQFTKWLYERGSVVKCEFITPQLAAYMIPVYVNAGIVGYTAKPTELARVLRFMKRSGFLPPLSSSSFSIPERRVFIFMDDGRPLRPLIICEPRGLLPARERFQRRSWREYVVGTLREHTGIGSREFVDPLESEPSPSLRDYILFFEQRIDKLGLIEYIDPYEQNEVLIASYPEHIGKETTHMEVHPSTILGLLGNMIPYPHHNQSPRNQLSASQSKQGLSMYATNWTNRFDNTANVLCYGEAPICRTIYQDYIGDGRMSYGQNIILAMGVYGGYNQEDGIIMNADALARGQFRSINYRSYEAFEEDDEAAHTKTRIGNPSQIPGWTELNPRYDYTKLDDNGLIREGEYVDQNTVIVGRYMQGEKGAMKDASVTPQVWTSGRVEKVVVLVSNTGLRLVKVRITKDRVPELGDKFSNRHGQKGTINVLYRGHDMPRTADGIVPDMIMNPSALPSRMTIGQILEMIMGQAAASLGAIGNVTAFMNDGSPHEALGAILEKMGFNKMCNQILYNGMTGEQMTADIFMGVVYGMRLKHMTEDKWNARGEGRREQRTHQPTGGRGNEGGLKIGEMERDAIIAHGVSSFLQESMMKRSDGSTFFICNGCGTIPIYNERQGLYICTMCDGPIQFSGDTTSTLDPIPPNKRSATTFSKVEMPYATKLFDQEMATFMNMSMRYLTTRDTMRLNGLDSAEQLAEANATTMNQVLQPILYPSHHVPELVKQVALPTAGDIQKTLAMLNDEARSAYQAEIASVVPPPQPEVGNEQEIQLAPNSFGPPSMGPTQPAQPTTIIPVAQAVNGEGVIATTDDGAPIINIDTSERALQAEGLSVPSDATRSLQPPPMQGQMGGQWGPPPIRRQRRAPSQPRYQQQQPYQQPSWGPSPQQQMNDGRQGFDEPNEEAQQKPSGPVKVIKMG
jgi:DNA-directed RNA polymerase II subunit RPB2